MMVICSLVALGTAPFEYGTFGLVAQSFNGPVLCLSGRSVRMTGRSPSRWAPPSSLPSCQLTRSGAGFIWTRARVTRDRVLAGALMAAGLPQLIMMGLGFGM